MNKTRKLKDKSINKQAVIEPGIEMPQEEIKQKKWHQKRWVRIVALCLAVSLIVSELLMRYISDPTAGTGLSLQPQALMDAEVKALMEHPLDVMKALKEADQEAKKEQQELIDACDKAETYISEGKYAEAIEPVNYLIDHMQLTEDELEQLKTTRTALYFSSSQFEEAEKGCTELIESGSKESGYYYFMRSVCYIQKEEYALAKDDILAALENGYEEQALCYVHLAFCENYLEDYESLLEHAQLALDMGADEVYRPTLIYLLALSALKLEKFEESISYLSKLIQMDEYKESGELYYYRGVSELTLAKFEEAYADCNLAMEYGMAGEDSTDAEAEEKLTMLYYNRAVAALGLNKLDEAAEGLEKVVERGDNQELKETSQELLELLDQANMEQQANIG